MVNEDLPTNYDPWWPEWNNGSDAFSEDDSYLDRTGQIEKSVDLPEETD